MNSASAGISGSAGERVVVVTAKARSLPWRINPIEPGRLSKVTCTRFVIRSVYASKPAIGHIENVGIGHQLEQFGGHVHRRAVASCCISQLAGIGLRQR